MNKGKVLKRRKKLFIALAIIVAFLLVITIIALVGTNVSMNTVKLYGKVKDVTYSVEDTEYGFKIVKSNQDDFRILQLTDIHIGAGIISIKNDRMAITAISTVVEEAQPDFIVVTGDMAYPVPFQSGTVNNLKAHRIFATLMDNFGIPWTITFGNHDTESYSLYNRKQIAEFYEKETKNCVFTRGNEDIFGEGNFIITLHNAGGALNTALVMIDSNDYIKGLGINKYDIIHDDQIQWYKREINKLSEAEGKIVQSMMFFHIPLREFDDSYKLYQNNSDEVKYFFGKQREKVYHSLEESNAFDEIVALQSTKAIFVGHDHINDSSIEYKGVRLTYGKSIDYLAYAWSGIIKKTEQRGGTVIDIKESGEFEISTIRYSDIKK